MLTHNQKSGQPVIISNSSRRALLKNRWFQTIIAVLAFCILAYIAHWPIYPGDPNRLPICNCLDPTQSVWFLRWVPYAISHGLNPFFSNWINYPIGTNLAQNTIMPILGILSAPLTLFISPVASFNFLAWLALVLSASSMYYVVLKLMGNRLAAFVAGILYGFSPYMVGQDQAHIMLSFVPIPPLIIYSVWKLLNNQGRQTIKLGIILAIEVIVQFLISPEVLAITFILITIGIFILTITHMKLVNKKRLSYIAKGAGITVIISIIFLSYPIWYMSSGSEHFSGTNFPVNNSYRSDVIGLVVPTLNEHFVPSKFHKYASQTALGDYQEIGDYIGPFLLLIMLISVIRWRRNLWLSFTAILALCSWILSMGPHLIYNGHVSSIPLPFDILSKLTFIQDILPSRFSLVEWLSISLFIALCIVELGKEYQNLIRNHTRIWISRSIFIVLGVGAVISLIPNFPYESTPINIPTLFRKNNNLIQQSTNLLSYPFPVITSDQAMLYQAVDNMKFKTPGGYIYSKGLNGEESLIPPLLTPPSVEAWLEYEQGVPATLITVPSSSTSQTDIKDYLVNYKIGEVAVSKDFVNSNVVADEFKSVLGHPLNSDGVLLWKNVQQDLNRLK
jgi:hypothetical protein